MCYHTSSPSKDKLKDRLGAEYTIEPYSELAFANGFDHPELPVILNEAPHTVQPIIWGFLPPEKTREKPYAGLNARDDQLFVINSWKRSARERRCLIFGQGFYEWQKLKGSKKQPYYIEQEDQQPFAFGGIWNAWQFDNKLYKGCAMVTTTANTLLTEIRPETPRMPFIVPRELWNMWLSHSSKEAELMDIIKPAKNGLLRASKLAESPLKRK